MVAFALVAALSNAFNGSMILDVSLGLDSKVIASGIAVNSPVPLSHPIDNDI